MPRDTVHPPASGLAYVNDHEPGLSRTAGATGFSYRDAGGKPVRVDCFALEWGMS